MSLNKKFIITILASLLFTPFYSHALTTGVAKVTKVLTVQGRVVFQTDLPIENPLDCEFDTWYEMEIGTSSSPTGPTATATTTMAIDILLSAKQQNLDVTVVVDERLCSLAGRRSGSTAQSGFPRAVGISLE